ncbi:hypothetical protein [Pediococcus pentosaceus]|jgi:hypothetical protein|uniref:Uncharacterized protein n=1 Tax=Pediococcus pentosaceus TaxID=1255 RepID=A0AB73HDF0_PEDPE|nr:hypothetical protein [Pediococcus pentosaceus]MBF7114487.1 hypothetical protein [Pediococcus pentosaceus]MCM6793050.1 hypothetical protein [Pediococcus pentosaceus]
MDDAFKANLATGYKIAIKDNLDSFEVPMTDAVINEFDIVNFFKSYNVDVSVELNWGTFTIEIL